MKDIFCRYHGGETLPPLERFPDGAAMAAFAEEARRKEKRQLWRIPPDNAPLARAIPIERYHTAEAYPVQAELEQGAAAELWTAMDRLEGDGPPECKILFALEGPFTALSRVLPLEEVYATSLEGSAVFARVEEQLVRCGELAAAHGAGLFSLADPVASPGLTGAAFFQKACLGPLRSLLLALRWACPAVPIHLCSALSSGLLACGACRAAPLSFRPGAAMSRPSWNSWSGPRRRASSAAAVSTPPTPRRRGSWNSLFYNSRKSEVIDYVSGHSSP